MCYKGVGRRYMGGLGVCYKCYTFLASLDINQPPNFTKVAPIFDMLLNKLGRVWEGVRYIYNPGESYNSIVHIFYEFVKSFAK